MSVETSAHKLEQLEQKIKKILESYHYLKDALRECQNENEMLTIELDKKNEEIKNFINQDKMIRIANVVADDKKISVEYKQKINEYIKEIEKSLAYLNKV
jgi:regulator of replication initiation timing